MKGHDESTNQVKLSTEHTFFISPFTLLLIPWSSALHSDFKSFHIASKERHQTHFEMADFEKAIHEAVDAQEIPGCVLLASNRDGTPHSRWRRYSTHSQL